MQARRQNSRACVETLEEIFAERDLDQWRRLLDQFDGQWTAWQTPLDVHDDPQVLANGFIAEVEMVNGAHVPMVTSPVQFDEQPNRPRRGPEHGEHTEEVLLEVGLSWDQIGSLKQRGAIL
jgi:crotonobetainyl-CoA:carnitine CoA-transferase CaiB-like acyl-CoA transferase